MHNRLFAFHGFQFPVTSSFSRFRKIVLKETEMRIYHWTALVVASLLTVGCGEVDAPKGTTSSTAATAHDAGALHTSPASAGIANEDRPEISAETKSWNELQKWIASQRGKVVVIDVWSTFCLPCMQEFPHFVEFHRTYGDRVACASFNVDFFGGESDNLEDVRTRVLKFLALKNTTMQNFISEDPDEVVLRHIETASIPAALVFDRQGNRHKVFNNDNGDFGPDGFNYKDDVTPLVEMLLQ